jgi:carbamoyl-phosphate synthase large subunit
MALHDSGVLDQYGCRADRRRTSRRSDAGEDRQKFKDIVASAAARESARSVICHTMDEVPGRPPPTWATPWWCAPSFTMGGLGSGIAYDATDLERIAGAGMHASPVNRGAAGGVHPAGKSTSWS